MKGLLWKKKYALADFHHFLVSKRWLTQAETPRVQSQQEREWGEREGDDRLSIYCFVFVFYMR